MEYITPNFDISFLDASGGLEPSYEAPSTGGPNDLPFIPGW